LRRVIDEVFIADNSLVNSYFLSGSVVALCNARSANDGLRGGAMTTFDPPQAGSAWQLPWLRVSLILRRMATIADCRDEDLTELVLMRRELARSGWFN
jgi:hypothetical protein